MNYKCNKINCLKTAASPNFFPGQEAASRRKGATMFHFRFLLLAAVPFVVTIDAYGDCINACSNDDPTEPLCALQGGLGCSSTANVCAECSYNSECQPNGVCVPSQTEIGRFVCMYTECQGRDGGTTDGGEDAAADASSDTDGGTTSPDARSGGGGGLGGNVSTTGGTTVFIGDHVGGGRRYTESERPKEGCECLRTDIRFGVTNAHAGAAVKNSHYVVVVALLLFVFWRRRSH